MGIVFVRKQPLKVCINFRTSQTKIIHLKPYTALDYKCHILVGVVLNFLQTTHGLGQHTLRHGVGAAYPQAWGWGSIPSHTVGMGWVGQHSLSCMYTCSGWTTLALSMVAAINVWPQCYRSNVHFSIANPTTNVQVAKRTFRYLPTLCSLVPHAGPI